MFQTLKNAWKTQELKTKLLFTLLIVILYRLGTQVESQCDEDRLYVLAASNGKKHAAMIANLTGKKQDLTIEGVDLENARYSLIDQEHLLSWIPNANEIQNNDVVLIEW